MHGTGEQQTVGTGACFEIWGIFLIYFSDFLGGGTVFIYCGIFFFNFSGIHLYSCSSDTWHFKQRIFHNFLVCLLLLLPDVVCPSSYMARIV